MGGQSDEHDKPFPTKAEAPTRDAELAMQEYQEERVAMADKTARLRALCLARDASTTPAAKKGGNRPARLAGGKVNRRRHGTSRQ